MRSGYVYLGQFIDHDIARDIRLLDETGCDVEHTLNYRTRCLDLDPLYGKDPSTVPCIYEDDGRLMLGQTKTVNGLRSLSRTVARPSLGSLARSVLLKRKIRPEVMR